MRRVLVVPLALTAGLALGACGQSNNERLTVPTVSSPAEPGSASATSPTTSSPGSAAGTGSAPASGSGSATTSPGAGGSAGGATTTSTPVTGPEPTLGASGSTQNGGVGFGLVRPSEISVGGGPAGRLTGIVWQSWGGTQATGSGTSTYSPPGLSVPQHDREKATVVAFDLATCKGAPAYKAVKWYFPDQGETLITGANSTVHACHGG